MGRDSLDSVTGEDCLMLRGIGQRIKDGETTVDDAFKVAGAKAQELDDKLALGQKEFDA